MSYSIQMEELSAFVNKRCLFMIDGIYESECDALIIEGENGVGKSAFLKALAGYNYYSLQGKFLILNENKKKIGRFLMMPQDTVVADDVLVAEYLARKCMYFFDFKHWVSFTTIHSLNWWSELIIYNEDLMHLLNNDLGKKLSELNYAKKRFLDLITIPIVNDTVVLLDEPFENLGDELFGLAKNYIANDLKDSMLILVDHTKKYKMIDRNYVSIDLNYYKV